MDKELNRLASFSTWPDSAQARPFLLAKHGFYYSGMEDRVTCFKCSVQLDNWTSDDDVGERHRQQSPNCQLLRETNKKNLTQVPVSYGKLWITETDLPETNHVPDSEKIQEIYRQAMARATRTEIFSTSPVNKIDRLNPDYDQLRHEHLRLSTYHDWPSVAQADPQALAREGLFYTGEEDRVQCAFCGGFIRNWEPTDIPSAEHKKHFPDCPFVRGLNVGNISVTREISVNNKFRKTSGVDRHQDAQLQRFECTQPTLREQIRYVAPSRYSDPPKYPEFADGKRRIESFKKGKVASGHTAEALAEAGWFFIGPGDKVQCFHCGGNMKEWEPHDDPWDEHKRWFANCSYINTQRPSATRRQFQEQTRPTTTTLATDTQFKVEPREVKARMDTARVRAILGMGYSRELVRKTVEDRFSTTGDDFPNAESLLEALFLIEATNPMTSASGFTSTKSSPIDHIAETLQYAEENRQLREARTCKVCMDAEVNTVFLPCGHLVCCNSCSRQLRNCPICRTFIRGTVKTFLA